MLSACHDRVQRSLDLLGRLVEHVDLHGHDASSRSAAADVLRYFTLAAPLHHQDEELHLFPLLLAHGSAEMVTQVERLQHDHAQMESLWRGIEPALRAWSSGVTTPLTSPQRDAIQVFRALYPPHIALEESSVFPQAFALLGPQASSDAGREMQSRRGVGHNAGLDKDRV